MTELLETAGRWAVPHVWLPLAAWTLAALPVHLALRRLDVPALGHVYARQGLLAALVLGLPAAALVDASAPAALPGAAVVAGWMLPPVAVGAAAADVAWPAVLSGWALAVAVSAGLMGLLRLAVQGLRLRRWRRDLGGSAEPALQREARRLADRLGLHRPVRVVFTAARVVPMAFGVRRPMVVLPEALRHDDPARRLALAHELVHLRRGDVAAHLLEQAVAAVFAVHPLVHALVRGIGPYREQLCDAETVGCLAVSRRRYAHLLVDLLPAPAPAAALAVGLAAPASELRGRLEALRRSSTNPNHAMRTKTLTLLAAALLLGATTTLVACSDDVVSAGAATEAPATEAPAAAKADAEDDLFVVVEQMPQLVGGLAAIQQNLTYPVLAKEAGIEGRVIVQFIVDEEGRVVEPRVVKGIGGGCDEEALRAVAEATFEPGYQRGKAVRVKMSVPITFRLGDEKA